MRGGFARVAVQEDEEPCAESPSRLLRARTRALKSRAKKCQRGHRPVALNFHYFVQRSADRILQGKIAAPARSLLSL